MEHLSPEVSAPTPTPLVGLAPNAGEVPATRREKRNAFGGKRKSQKIRCRAATTSQYKSYCRPSVSSSRPLSADLISSSMS